MHEGQKLGEEVKLKDETREMKDGRHQMKDESFIEICKMSLRAGLGKSSPYPRTPRCVARTQRQGALTGRLQNCFRYF